MRPSLCVNGSSRTLSDGYLCSSGYAAGGATRSREREERQEEEEEEGGVGQKVVAGRRQVVTLPRGVLGAQATGAGRISSQHGGLSGVRDKKAIKELVSDLLALSMSRRAALGAEHHTLNPEPATRDP